MPDEGFLGKTNFAASLGNDWTREDAWLIEGDGNYWNGEYNDVRGFTRDIDLAVRFARSGDADAVRYGVLKQFAFALRTVQHAWAGSAKAKG
jgi:hypothetical protein